MIVASGQDEEPRGTHCRCDFIRLLERLDAGLWHVLQLRWKIAGAKHLQFPLRMVNDKAAERFA